MMVWKATHGGGSSCRVPNNYAAPAGPANSGLAKSGLVNEILSGPANGSSGQGIKLGRWVERQRAAWATGKLSAARQQRLRAAGFEFAPHAREWATRVRLLAAFVAHHGHAKVGLALVR
jgi:hypothetical protein